MNKPTRIIIGTTPLVLGVVMVVASVSIMIKGDAFWSWLSPGLFGLVLVIAGILIMSGVSLREIFEDFI